MREEVCTQAPGSGSLWGRTRKKWGCLSSTTASRTYWREEIVRNRLPSKGNGSIIAHGWDAVGS